MIASLKLSDNLYVGNLDSWSLEQGLGSSGELIQSQHD